MSLVLVGTVHIDLKGERRLEKTLRFLKPDIINIEKSPDIEKEYRIFEKYQSKTLKITNNFLSVLSPEVRRVTKPVLKKINRIYGYEYKIPEKYAKKNNIQINYIEKFATRIKFIKNILSSSMLFLENQIKEISSLSKEEYNKRMKILLKVYSNFQKEADSNYNQKKYKEIITQLISERDIIMAKKTKEIVKNNPKKKIINVNGIIHLFSYKGTMSSLLKNLKPRIFPLKKADAL